MNWGSWLLWGFLATVVLTTMAAGGRRLHVTRMDMPYMLGTMLTSSRDKAMGFGLAMHFLNGWMFSLIYVLVFHALGMATWWLGALGGIAHAAFFLAVGIPVLPHVHPRMASAVHGPSVARQLEPPGFLALNYGKRTPIGFVLAHVTYGAILGGFYSL